MMATRAIDALALGDVEVARVGRKRTRKGLGKHSVGGGVEFVWIAVSRHCSVTCTCHQPINGDLIPICRPDSDERQVSALM
jgi:hypothetical protein